MKKIPITGGYWLTVDDADYEAVMRWSWCLTNGYPSRRKTLSKNKSKTVYLHRELMNPTGKHVVDHINGNKLDNRRENLRVCTHAQNMVNWNNNRGESKFRGVSWDKTRNKWKAQIQCNGKNRFIGRYSTEEEAAKAYNAEAEIVFGEFRHNEVA